MSLRAEIRGPLDLLDLHALDPRAYPFLLQSVAGHPQSGRFDILFAFPQEHLELRAGQVAGRGAGADFFAALSAWFDAQCSPAQDPDLPFSGGWFLLLGYEAAQHIEPRLSLPPSPFTLPDALAVRCPAAVVVDRRNGTVTLVAERDPVQLERLRTDVARAMEKSAAPADRARLLTSIDEDPPQRFLDGVERIHEYLKAGDVFQVNLSRGWRGRLRDDADCVDAYRRLREHNPAPFAGLARWGGAAVLSSSPERLVSVDGAGLAQTRPIAGTRPRGADEPADRALRERLLESVKERAEHIMLIDLERNDLGRVCEPGSIEVSELMTVESYAHVHHIVSNVRGRLRGGVGPGATIRAVFPGGTITGCPKLRAMEIIAELEGVGRGPYTGAMGYLSRDGRLDTNILIRSLVCEGRAVAFRCGAGIVADSRAEAELEETRIKARGLLLALGAP